MITLSIFTLWHWTEPGRSCLDTTLISHDQTIAFCILTILILVSTLVLIIKCAFSLYYTKHRIQRPKTPRESITHSDDEQQAKHISTFLEKRSKATNWTVQKDCPETWEPTPFTKPQYCTSKPYPLLLFIKTIHALNCTIILRQFD